MNPTPQRLLSKRRDLSELSYRSPFHFPPHLYSWTYSRQALLSLVRTCDDIICHTFSRVFKLLKILLVLMAASITHSLYGMFCTVIGSMNPSRGVVLEVHGRTVRPRAIRWSFLLEP